MSTDYTNALTWGADCIGVNAHALPAGIPALWPYWTGTSTVVWPHAQVARIAPKFLIRVNQGFDSRGFMDGDEFDVEAGAWTIPQCVDITRSRRAIQWATKFYATWDFYGQIKGELSDAGITTSVFYRIADWNWSKYLAEQALHGDVYAGQYASPTSNPDTLFPGTSLTLSQLGADLNVLIKSYVGWNG